MTGWQRIVVFAMCFVAAGFTVLKVPDPDARTAMIGLVMFVAGYVTRTAGDVTPPKAGS